MMHRSYSAPITAAAGLIAMVVAMGIGRFAFTPILPMMQEDVGLTVAEGGWLAASNYAGYLLGAISATGYRLSRLVAIMAGLLMIGLATLAMGLGDNFIVWNVLRFLAGVASAWVLISGSSWCLERLAELGSPRFSGVVFAGVGVGIVVAGVACLVMMHRDVGSAGAWIAFGAMSLLLTAIAWPVFRPANLSHPPSPDISSFPWSADAMRLVLCYGISGFGYIIPATFLPAMAHEVIRDPAVFGWSWPVFGVAAIVSTLAAAVLTERFSNRRLWAWSHVVMAVGVALPVFWSGIASIMLAGLFVGGTFMVIVMVALREARDVGGVHATRLIGAITASFALGQIVGPIAVSYLVRATGSFSVALLVASGLLVVSAIALLHSRRLMKTFALLCLAAVLTACAGRESYDKVPPVVGAWKWVRGDCSEVFVYRDDGTLTVFSGERRFEETFSVSRELNDAGLYVIDGVTHFNSEGVDCTGGSEDLAGKSFTVYLRFDPSFQLMWVYDDPAGKRGTGPLLRIPN